MLIVCGALAVTGAELTAGGAAATGGGGVLFGSEVVVSK